MAVVLTISDLHAPFQHKHALDFLRDLRKEYRPDHVVCLGDEIDAHNFARWDRDADAIGPREELSAARQVLRDVAKLFPVLSIVESNHTYRPWKKAAGVGLTRDFLRSRRDVLETPAAWHWSDTYRIDGVTYLHGEGFAGANAARDASTAYMGSVAIGHVHSYAGIAWRHTLAGQTIFGANFGCLIDETQPAFNYAKHHRNRPVLGTGVVIDGVPRFIPMGGAK